MQIIETTAQMKTYRSGLSAQSIGFVPTMGNLHRGHISLLSKAREQDVLILSIFVNPTQFNDVKDYQGYPKILEEDLKQAKKMGVDAVFLPTELELYPNGYSYQVKELECSNIMEGKLRPGHFEGMLTVVLKLLNVVKPHKAYFGEKDYQQYFLIKKMIEDLFLGTEVILCDTVRDKDGLALSSRNTRLTFKHREIAPKFYNILSQAVSCDDAYQRLTQEGFKVDYIEDFENRRFGAVSLGKVRLIDNVRLNQ